jgi:hypothetical protein
MMGERSGTGGRMLTHSILRSVKGSVSRYFSDPKRQICIRAKITAERWALAEHIQNYTYSTVPLLQTKEYGSPNQKNTNLPHLLKI